MRGFALPILLAAGVLFTARAVAEPQAINRSKGNKPGIWQVIYHPDEFMDTSTPNRPIAIRLRIEKTSPPRATLYRFRRSASGGYELMDPGGLSFELDLLEEHPDVRKREKIHGTNATQNLAIFGFWHPGIDKAKTPPGNSPIQHPQRKDDTLHLRIKSTAAAAKGAGQQDGCGGSAVLADPDCPDEPDTDVLEEEYNPDPEVPPAP